MLEWQWYKDTIVKVVFIHCLLMANYADKKWQNIIIKRGQFKTTITQLAEELNLSSKQVRVSLEKLKETDEIKVVGANKYSLITICKYDDYQQKNSELTNFKANKGQTKGKQTPSPIVAVSIDNINNINSEYTDIKNNNINPNGYDIISKKNEQSQVDLFGNEVIPKKKGKRKTSCETILLSQYGVSEQHLNDWLIARKKKPITETVLQYLVKEAAKANISVADAVRISAENSWQGFKAEWYQNLNNRQNGFYNGQRQDRRGESPVSDFANAKPEDFQFRV